MKAPVVNPLCEGPWIGLACLSPCFHFEQYCWQIKTYKETHLDRLYCPGCLEYPSPHDGNRLGSQKKKEVQRDFTGLLSLSISYSSVFNSQPLGSTAQQTSE